VRWLKPGGNVEGGADKFLAQRGRKQATATKLRIYSTYSPTKRNTLLSLCSNFSSHPKEKKKKVVRPTSSPRQQ